MQLIISDSVKTYSKELMLLMTILFVLSLLIELFNIDRYIADHIYLAEGSHWQLKNAWVTAILIHKGGKYLSIFLLLIIFALFIASAHVSDLKPWRKQFGYLLVASLLGALGVNLIKEISQVSCPWDFSRYGGHLDYLSLSEQLFVRNGNQCFPAGHASAGYAWVALYFVGRYFQSSWRWWFLAFSLLLGMIFGIAQQLRGAHFISHDLWSFGICWMVSLTCYFVMLQPYESNH